ncbi:hypothetical protein SLE2022_133510 [Rubroshorea leprosula]
MEGNLGCFGNFIQWSKPYIAMISQQFGYAGVNIITKVSLNRGMNHYVLVVYRHTFATAVIAPFALILERKVRPKITFPIFKQIFVLGLLGLELFLSPCMDSEIDGIKLNIFGFFFFFLAGRPVIDQNLYNAGLKFTSSTFSCAMSNMLPDMTFVMAVLCRSTSKKQK